MLNIEDVLKVFKKFGICFLIFYSCKNSGMSSILTFEENLCLIEVEDPLKVNIEDLPRPPGVKYPLEALFAQKIC